MHKLNINQETRVMTKSGLRDTIIIEDSIRQRTPLLGPEFGLLIDELNLELRTTDLGVQYGFIILIGLLFMDDIASLARSDKELHEVLSITSLFLNMCQLILRKLLPILTPLVSIYIENKILPLNLECEKYQLMYL